MGYVIVTYRFLFRYLCTYYVFFECNITLFLRLNCPISWEMRQNFSPKEGHAFAIARKSISRRETNKKKSCLRPCWWMKEQDPSTKNKEKKGKKEKKIYKKKKDKTGGRRTGVLRYISHFLKHCIRTISRCSCYYASASAGH